MTISGYGENGADVTLFDYTHNDGAQNGGVFSHGRARDAGGVIGWGIAVSGADLHHVRAIQTDIAGNPSTSSAALDITIDTTAPAAPTALDLDAEIGRASCRERV